MLASAVSRIPTLVPPLRGRNPTDGVLLRTFPTRKSEPRQEGVALQSVSPAQSRHLSAPCPHAVFDIESFCSEDQRVTMPRGFRALFPARIRTRFPTEVECGSMLSWAFLSRRGPGSALAAEPVARLSPQSGVTPVARRLRRSRLSAVTAWRIRLPLAGLSLDPLRHPSGPDPQPLPRLVGVLSVVRPEVRSA